jgi:hypothetical protein
MNKKVVVIVILVILIIGIAVGAYFILNMKGKDKAKCPSGKISYSKYYMHGIWVRRNAGAFSIPEANIKTVGGVTYYIIFDKPYTKIISSQKDASGKNIAKYYTGPISDFNASSFSTYSDATGKYLLGEKDSYCGDVCSDDEIQYPDSTYKKCIFSRVDSAIDIGYEDVSTRPLKRGYYDIIGQGVANDYCRYTGDGANIKFRCNLSNRSGTNYTVAETYGGRNVTDIVSGKQPVDAPPSIVVGSEALDVGGGGPVGASDRWAFAKAPSFPTRTATDTGAVYTMDMELKIKDYRESAIFQNGTTRNSDQRFPGLFVFPPALNANSPAPRTLHFVHRGKAGSVTSFVTNGQFPEDAWFRFTIVANKTQLKAYFNKVKDTLKEDNRSTEADPMAYPITNDWRWDAYDNLAPGAILIRNFKVYNGVAMTDEQVSNL